ncbi:hypothetical protein K1T71_003488 [Dendrolimus kikuchii]|uniref:Uncharacterized protein n=1 Tax=Dendrolimus kikuchii TaxID=765133 RepID=A0ACC1DBU6_9NEOP|nr:hypothetical protein K1T71_003488 [Dendrolimus kikuchii]
MWAMKSIIIKVYLQFLIIFNYNLTGTLRIPPKRVVFKQSSSDTSCDNICEDLPERDPDPVCMMFSRYKKGYQYFVNECHARRAVCKENLVLHVVHPSRCMKSNQFFMPIF